MGALEIRKDRTSTVLRKLVKGESDGRVARRILAIANALDGMSREAAARSAGMDRQTLRDWVIRYTSMVSRACTIAGAMGVRRPSRVRSKPN